MSLSHLGHMRVGALWQSNANSRGVPNLMREVLAAEPHYPYTHQGMTAKQILWNTQFNLKLEKDLVAIAEASQAKLINKVVVPTMLTGDIAPKSPASVVAKDKYQLAAQMAEAQYKKAYLEKPWGYMFAYYCDEDRARLCGGIGYVGHHGGGDIKVVSYHDYLTTVVYPTIFYMAIVWVVSLFAMYYWIYGTFFSGMRNRYD
jgi:hypothetical protein